MKSRLRINEVMATPKNPISIEIPKGYAAILSRPTLFSFIIRNNPRLILSEVDSNTVELNRPTKYSIIRMDETINYTYLADFKCNFKVSRILIEVSMNLNDNAVRSASIYKNYDVGDLGIFDELDEVIGEQVDRINNSLPEFNEKNYESIKSLIRDSIKRVMQSYSIQVFDAKFVDF